MSAYLRTMGAAALLAWTGAASAQEFDALSWHVTFYDLNETTREVTLTFGVPETDWVMASSSCRSGMRLKDFPINLALGGVLDLDAVNNGDAVTFAFDPDFFEAGYEAVAQVPESGEGLYGVVIETTPGDDLWNAMKTSDEMRYTVNGEVMTLPLKGSFHAVAEFLRLCVY